MVGGRSVQPQRTDVRPQLPPAQADGSVLPVFSVGDNFAGLNLPTSPMPTLGTATYSTILAKSGVIDSNGILPPGTLNSAAVSVNFGALTANTSLSGMVGGQSFSVTGSGSVSGNTMSSPLNGLIGATSCNGSVSGTFYGSLADHVGISYTFTDTVKTFNGTAVLGQ